MSSPLTALPADVFGCIVKKVASRERLAPPGNLFDVRKLCQNYFKARRELRTLALVPGQTVDPKYLCTDPNGALWQHAHIIFGINPDAPGFGKMPRCTLRDNFLLLRAAFEPDLEYEVWRGDFSSRQYGVGEHEAWTTFSVWAQLWGEWDPEEVNTWENQAAQHAYEDYVAEQCGSGEDDDDAHEAPNAYDDFQTWYNHQAERGTLPKYPVSMEQLVWFHSKLRLPRGSPQEVDEPLLMKMRMVLKLMLSDMGGRDLAMRELKNVDDDKRHLIT